MAALSRLFRLWEPTVLRVEFRAGGRLVGWRDERCEPFFPPRRAKSRLRRSRPPPRLRATG